MTLAFDTGCQSVMDAGFQSRMDVGDCPKGLFKFIVGIVWLDEATPVYDVTPEGDERWESDSSALAELKSTIENNGAAVHLGFILPQFPGQDIALATGGRAFPPEIEIFQVTDRPVPGETNIAVFEFLRSSEPDLEVDALAMLVDLSGSLVSADYGTGLSELQIHARGINENIEIALTNDASERWLGELRILIRTLAGELAIP